MKKKEFTANRWLIIFIAFVFFFVAMFGAFNYIVDPFGAFGDRFFQWWSADETVNPRVAKISYLEEHHSEYDSYIIGCSSTSSFPKEALDKYYNADFYNLIMYGADMQDVSETVDYISENYEVKNLVLNVYIDNGIHYATEPDALTYGMHYKVDGSSPLLYCLKYLFAPPSYGLSKLENYRNDSYMQQSFDVFDTESGAYDKSLRDIEAISDMDSYLAAYPCFVNYYFPPEGPITRKVTAETMTAVAHIKSACEAKGIHLTVVTAPVYKDYLAQFDAESVTDFYSSLAEVTDFWDFSYSSVSTEPRYFYDETHFRNSVGAMALAKIFDDDSLYVPADFGHLVTAENAADYFKSYWELSPIEAYTKAVPILMYHNIAETGDNQDTISVARFEEQLRALTDAGYVSVDFSQLKSYVCAGTPLPEKSVVITFDDGYLSNYEIALPILQKYGMKATVFCIGVSVGKDTYKDTGKPITPHFSLEEAQKMAASDIFTVAGHSYDLHGVEGFDDAPVREGVLPLAGESEADYIEVIRKDTETMNALLESVAGEKVTVYSYPLGFSSPFAAALLKEEGFDMTVIAEDRSNILVKGLPQCLLEMGRLFAVDNVSGEELVKWVDGK